jgi:putative protease
MPENNQPIGEVTHYYNKIGVAIVKFFKTVPVGTRVKFHGATTDFEQTISSMQFDHKEISEAKKNQEVGIKVDSKVREGDKVYEVK